MSKGTPTEPVGLLTSIFCQKEHAEKAADQPFAARVIVAHVHARPEFYLKIEGDLPRPEFLPRIDGGIDALHRGRADADDFQLPIVIETHGAEILLKHPIVFVGEQVDRLVLRLRRHGRRRNLKPEQDAVCRKQYAFDFPFHL